MRAIERWVEVPLQTFLSESYHLTLPVGTVSSCVWVDWRAQSTRRCERVVLRGRVVL